MSARSEALASRLQEKLHNALNLRFEVETVPADSLPRFEAKSKRWIRIEPESLAESEPRMENPRTEGDSRSNSPS